MSQSQPPILIGLDARPIGMLPDNLKIGNAAHRYDDGPQHKDTMAQWLQRCEELGLWSVVQGTKAIQQDVNLLDYPHVVAVAHDDEPDLNRWRDSDPHPELYYSPQNAPHPGVVGWTLPAVVAARRAAFAARWPGLPVAINFAGPSLDNAYYAAPLVWHKPYIEQAQQYGFDKYPKNNQGDGGTLYAIPYIMLKMREAGAATIDVYIEGSDQALDGIEGGGPTRGPTPNEQATQLWAALCHGARRIWYFPQRIGRDGRPGFLYNNFTTDNWNRAVFDWGIVQKHMDLIEYGDRRLVKQEPGFWWTPSKGKFGFPQTEMFVFSHVEFGTLSVVLDYTGANPPLFAFVAPDKPVPDVPDKPDGGAGVAELAERVAKLTGDVEAAKSAAAAAVADARLANERLDKIAAAMGRPSAAAAQVRADATNQPG